MRVLWTRIAINVDSEDTMNRITEEKGERPSLLATYIQRAVASNGDNGLLFDIRIIWGRWWEDYFYSWMDRWYDLDEEPNNHREDALNLDIERLAKLLPPCEQWRSLYIELPYIWAFLAYCAVELPVLTRCNGIPLSSLQSLTLKNIILRPGDITFPSLSYLYKSDAFVDPFTYPQSLKTLECYNTFSWFLSNIPWNDLDQLQELHIDVQCDSDYSFRPDALKNMRILHLEGEPYYPKITSLLPFLIGISNPLETIELAFVSINAVRDILLNDHDLHFRNVHISSRLFRSKPYGEEWRWERGYYGSKTWNVDSLEIEAACLLLDWAKTKAHVEVIAMDAQVDHIFRLAEELDPDEVRKRWEPWREEWGQDFWNLEPCNVDGMWDP